MNLLEQHSPLMNNRHGWSRCCQISWKPAQQLHLYIYHDIKPSLLGQQSFSWLGSWMCFLQLAAPFLKCRILIIFYTFPATNTYPVMSSWSESTCDFKAVAMHQLSNWESYWVKVCTWTTWEAFWPSEHGCECSIMEISFSLSTAVA